jgi:hypothetical protein
LKKQKKLTWDQSVVIGYVYQHITGGETFKVGNHFLCRADDMRQRDISGVTKVMFFQQTMDMDT